MRYVNRHQVASPGVLTAENGLGQNERSEATKFFEKILLMAEKEKADAANKEQEKGNAANEQNAPNKTSQKAKNKETFNFKAYKEESVKKALEKLFFGKCAYCEGRYSGIHPVDIEHWRPKAEVIVDELGKERRYGYYWLAADWENLLPSCIDCNRVRTHFDFLERKEVTLGKGNWFPLASDTKRAGGINDEKDEKPLLLNPCNDRPENYLEFHEEGFIKPRLNGENQPDEKALASIRFYALNRAELVHDRRERILLIKQKMATIRSLAKLFEREAASANQEKFFVIEDLLSHELEQLHRFQEPDQPFSAMAKQLIDKFIGEFRP